MQYNAKEPYVVETHWKIEEVLDGDSIIIRHRCTQMTKEVRLYGLDAPEIKYSRKMKVDEQKSQLTAQILIQFGLQSLHYVLSVAPPGTTVTIVTEKKYFLDYWHRQLGYVILPDGSCLNDLILSNGFAKATQEYYCSRLPELQLLNREAQMQKKGIYSVVNRF